MINRLLIFGASITQGYHDSEGGWADRLKKDLVKDNKEIAVFNLGISGDKTIDVLNRFDAEVEARTKRWDTFEETAIIIAVGTNDTYQEGSNSEPVTNKEGFRNNYRQLIEKAQQKANYVIVCSVLPFDESRTTPVSWRDIRYFNKVAEEYSQVLKEVCKELNVTFIDLNSMAQKIDWNSMLDDGVHPNDQGHKWIFDQVAPEVKKL